MSSSASYFLPLPALPVSTPATDPLDRLITQYKNKPHLRALLQSYLDELAEVGVAIEQLGEAFRLGGAVGAQLDLLGKIVGAARQGFDDATYAALIRAYIRAQKSEGKPEDLYSVFRTLLAPGGELTLDEHYPMALVLGFYQDVSFDPGILDLLLKLAKPQAVKSTLVFGRFTDVFQMAPGTSAITDPVKGIGTEGNATRGGRLARGL